MRSALSRIFAIASLRAGPQELPVSARLLAMAVIADLLISMIGLGSVMPAAQALAVAGLSIGLGLMFSYLVLYLRGLSSRFWQTASALIGADALISLVSLPLSLALADHAGTDAANVPPALAIALLAILGWNIAVVARIFRNALDQSGIGGFVIGLAYVFLTTGIAF